MVYLPPHFTETREEVLLAHIERHDFALLTTHGETGMIASQVPFLVERRDGSVYLQGHLARGNPQCLDIYAGGEALAIFSGPHAYISPSWYAAGPAVPTWNYASVHAYGSAARSTIRTGCAASCSGLSERHEAARADAVADAGPARAAFSTEC